MLKIGRWQSPARSANGSEGHVKPHHSVAPVGPDDPGDKASGTVIPCQRAGAGRLSKGSLVRDSDRGESFFRLYMHLEVVVIPVLDVDRAGECTRSHQLLLVRFVRRPGRQRLALPGGHAPPGRIDPK
jgi:hypothetical protein